MLLEKNTGSICATRCMSIDLPEGKCNFCRVLAGCMEAVLSVRDGIRTDKQKHGFARFENVPEGNVQIADIPGTSGREAANDDKGIKQAAGGRFENPLYRSKRDKTEERKILDLDAPLSLTTLKGKVEDRLENEEMDTEE